MTSHVEVVCVAGFGYIGGAAPAWALGPQQDVKYYALIVLGTCVGSSLGLLVSRAFDDDGTNYFDGAAFRNGLLIVVATVIVAALFIVPSIAYANGIIKDIVLFLVIVPLQFLTAATTARFLIWDDQIEYLVVMHTVISRTFVLAIVYGLVFFTLYSILSFFVAWVVITLAAPLPASIIRFIIEY
jgi:hypothetical protein